MARLALDVENARAEVVARKVKRIQDAGEKQWQADAWWLERNFPGMYSKRIEAKVEERVHVSVSEVDPDAKLAMLRYLAEQARLEAKGEQAQDATRLLPSGAPNEADEHTD